MCLKAELSWSEGGGRGPAGWRAGRAEEVGICSQRPKEPRRGRGAVEDLSANRVGTGLQKHQMKETLGRLSEMPRRQGTPAGTGAVSPGGGVDTGD